ncbi:HNH endonuclease [Burkholderia sp. Leaf177]|uniref:HNH endonuclease n=1 Tax=Burkholderia sp. Leaf177 TaxID=1736287 RepID=UPI0009EC355B|nr:HNH endonuclease [Burkholderia sp. Leaf177]
MKAIFDTKPTSSYDDDTSQHYHFPRRYLATVEKCVGDWIILRRPRADGGDLAYFATAKVTAVKPDTSKAGMSYAFLADYLPFDAPVAWMSKGAYAEQALRALPKAEVGVYLRGRSVRLLDEEDFIVIVSTGLFQSLGDFPRVLAETVTNTEGEAEERIWRIETALTNRIVRDANFRRSVCLSYGHRCAISGLRITDHYGRSEAQAAHIWPVADGGPDIVQNGLALSATVHWLFDRHLVTLSDDYRITSHRDKIPQELRSLFVKEGEIIHLPAKREDWPNPKFLARHRELFRLREEPTSFALDVDQAATGYAK